MKISNKNKDKRVKKCMNSSYLLRTACGCEFMRKRKKLTSAKYNGSIFSADVIWFIQKNDSLVNIQVVWI